MSVANCHQTEPGARPGLVVIPAHSLWGHYLENDCGPCPFLRLLVRGGEGGGHRRLSLESRGRDALSTAFRGLFLFLLWVAWVV